MADTDLPEGTDTIINGAGVGDETTQSSRVRDDTSLYATDTGTRPSGGVREAIKGGTDKLKSTANDRALGFVSQGIERSSGALSNVSALIGDTAASIDDRLGSQYGDYARQAAEAVERAARSLANKEPDELIDDARSLVRKSPGIALAGAAILGFALVRVVKSGLEDGGSKNRDRSTN